MLTHKEYCSTVCEAKCCYARYDEVPLMPCPKLGANNLCTIYKQRYEEGKPYSFTKVVSRNSKLLVINVACGKIEDILKTNELPDSVKKQCCYNNPQLLEVHHED